MKNLTQWQHFKKNYLNAAIFLTVLFLLSLSLSLSREDELWYLSFMFLIPVVVLFIGNYLSWRRKP